MLRASISSMLHRIERAFTQTAARPEFLVDLGMPSISEASYTSYARVAVTRGLNRFTVRVV
jgi:hypothetical protein